MTLGTLAGITQFLGYVVYVIIALKGKIKPNSSSWTMWTYGNILLTGTYINMVSSMSLKILPAICAISCVITWLILISKGKFEKMKWYEWYILGLDIAIGIFWFFSKDSKFAHLLIDGTAFISFIPITIEVYKHPEDENPLPWFIWSLAYCFLFVTTMEKELKHIEEVIYPAMYTIFHFIIAILSGQREQKSPIT